MSIKISKEKKGFTFNEKNYVLGDSLTELANLKFDKLKNFITSDFIDSSLTYSDYYKKILEFDYDSIHFQLLKESLRNFLETSDECDFNSDSNTKPYLFRKIENPDLLKHEIWNFFFPLFDCQKKVINILEYLSIKGNDKLTIYQKTFNLSKNSPEILDFSKNTSSSFNQFEDLSIKKITTDTKGNIKFEISISTVQELCFFELENIIEQLQKDYNSVKIISCKHCNKFFISNDIRKKFCSQKCKNNHYKTNKKECPFYKKYRNRYRNIYSRYTNNSKGLTIADAPFDELKELYNQYKNSDIKFLNEFEKKLKEIK